MEWEFTIEQCTLEITILTAEIEDFKPQLKIKLNKAKIFLLLDLREILKFYQSMGRNKIKIKKKASVCQMKVICHQKYM